MRGHISQEDFDMLHPILNADELRGRLRFELRRAVESFQRWNTSAECRLTVLLTWEGAQHTHSTCGVPRPDWLLPEWWRDAEGEAWTMEEAPFEVFTHAAPLPPVPTDPVIVQVAGQARHNASAKDSEWVRCVHDRDDDNGCVMYPVFWNERMMILAVPCFRREREALERALPADVHEGLLVQEEDPAGSVLEGTQTNFFVVQDGAVRTAGTGVLEGTIRKLVLECCERLDIPMVFDPPHLREWESWEAAFITSSSRLVLPVREVRIHESMRALYPGMDDARPFPASGSHPLVQRIRSEVRARLMDDSEEIIA